MTRLPAALLAALALAACDRQPTPTAAPAASAPAPAPPPAAAPSVAPAADAAPVVVEEFRPSRHGFKFVNAFRGSPLPKALRPLERVLGSTIPDRFGLCGGMCAAAADYFLAGVPIPAAVEAPSEGDDLYTELYNRQVDSFGESFGVPLRILQGMAMPDAGPGGLRAMNAREVPLVRERLRARELVTLCLVLGKTDGRTKPWDNHQVLAYADATADPAEPVLRIYDPNFPGDDEATLSFTTTADGLSCERRAHRRGTLSTTAVRGVFVGPYSKHTPTTPAPTPTPTPEPSPAQAPGK